MNNRMLASLAAEAAKRAWEGLAKCSPDRRVGLARAASVLDKLGKNCEQTAFVLDLLKDFEPSEGETTHAEFIVHQRDTMVHVLRSEEKLSSDLLDKVHALAQTRVAFYVIKKERRA